MTKTGHIMAEEVCVEGDVIKGFGRGSRELGIPTANFPEHIVEASAGALSTGVYYGWARVNNGDTHKMVMSVGWNPFYANERKSMETHLLHKFLEDFYGSTLRVVVKGYVRPELNFSSVDELIAAIENDIKMACDSLTSLEADLNADSQKFLTRNI